MGLFGIGKDVGSTVTLEYKANVEQAKAALRDLSGEQKKNAQAAVQGLEDQVKAHERLASKITLGIGIAAGAVALGIQGFKQYEEASRLSAASAGADMDRLRMASHGLLTDMELMGVAAQAMNGRFKLTSEELETVLGAAVALEARGIMPLSEATQKLGEAVKKGEIDPLKELGIVYDENLAKTDKRGAAMKALTALSAESAGATNSETEAVRQHGVEFRNSMDQIQQSIGKIVVALEPLISALSTIVGIAAGAAGVVSDIVGAIAGSKASRAQLAPFKGKGGWMGAAADLAEQETTWTEDVLWQRGTGLAGMGAAAVGAATSSVNAERERIANLGEMARRRRQQFNYEKRKAEQDRSAGVGNKPRTGGGGFELDAIVLDGSQWVAIETVDTLIDQMVQARLAELPFGTLGTEASDALAGSAPTARGYMAGSAVGSMGLGRMGVRLKEGPSFMERMLGPVSEIDRYATAWGTFTDAATSGYAALIDGSESAGAAMKRVIAQSVAAEGSRMLVLALREGAWAVAELAQGHFGSAASHALAAAKFGAGAAIAGVVANQLGGGGSAGASAGAGATSPTGVTAGETGGPITRNYIIGDSFGFETPRSQAARFANAERRTRMYEAPTAGVEYA